MTVRLSPSRDPLALEPEARATLAERAARALRAARRGRGRAVAAVTVPIPAELDVSAAVLAARRADDRFFCFEQPDRDGFALAGLGAAAVVEARGADRFAEAARRARELGGRSFADDPADDPARPAAAGPVFVGGFSFAAEGGATPEWSSLAPGLLVMPELSLVRHRGEARMTVCVAADGDEAPDALVERALARVDELAPAGMPMVDPDPVEQARVASAAPPSHFEHAV
ncbi:MAG TPA: hypothetical protein VGF25_05430, partial [Thermoleophilaceae bacterium]